MLITIRKLRESSITLVFNIQSDSRHNSTKLEVSDCCKQSSQNWWFIFFFLFWTSGWQIQRSPLSKGVSTAWCDVCLTSMIAPFARWCRSTAWTHSTHLLSTAMRLCIFLMPILKSIHMMEPLIKSFNKVAPINGFLSLRTLMIVSYASSPQLLVYHL
jgi:hypothetical protein